MRAHVTALGAVILAVGLGGCNQSSTSTGTAASTGSTGSSAASSPTSTTSGTTSMSSGAATTPAPAGAAAAALPGESVGGAKEVTTSSGLKYTDLKVGDGTVAENGMVASVHYTGWL